MAEILILFGLKCLPPGEEPVLKKPVRLMKYMKIGLIMTILKKLQPYRILAIPIPVLNGQDLVSQLFLLPL